ncbi:LAETG motif-containing sortase-dependent surface protein [Streptomyces sp. GSL17-111]|uniref:LAETG motif-containing sortase-dependent surface protein n=1 Tax=Streptomyces sp. GSL17-111 TaxID=3121596 RepID=UPI0030F4A03B
MRIRRAVAAAAATAVIAPAALLAAPAAYADENPGTESTQTEPKPGEEEAPKEETPAEETTDEEKTSEDETSTEDTTDDEKTSEGKTEGENDSEGKTDEETSPEDGTDEEESEEDGTDEEKPEGEKPGEDEESEEEETEEPVTEECLVTDSDDDLVSTINGLPEQVAAGAGWQNFSLTIENNTGEKKDFAQAHVYTWAFTEDGGDESEHISLQVKNIHGTWVDVDTDWSSDQYGFVGNGSLDAGQSSTLQLRLSVDEQAPASLGVALGYAFYLNDDGETCTDSVSEDYYFEIIAAGKKPNGNDAKPQGGKTELPAKPDSKPDADLKIEGELAQTGSDSNLPMFALAGAAAVALGAGAMFVVRRRKGADATA